MRLFRNLIILVVTILVVTVWLVKNLFAKDNVDTNNDSK